MIVRKRRGRRTLRCLAGLMACSFLSIPRMHGNKNISLKRLRGIRRNAIHGTAITNRITTTYWPNVFSLRKIRWGRCLAADETPLDATSGISMGWNFPLSRRVTTGPVAALHYDGSTSSMYNEYGDSATTLALTDPLWHASVSTLGWRVNSQFGDVRPRAQISYNQQFGENIWKAQSGLSRMTAGNQAGNWLDVTVGADVLLNPHWRRMRRFPGGKQRYG